ncbi:MAG: TlpA disulfide reductase family protein [Bacteroidales bacterium]|jgi:thiol-disulfide isomerase/thioredoxin
MNPKDSTAQILLKSDWAEEIKKYIDNYTFYEPIIKKRSYPFLDDSGHFDKKYFFKFIKEETINNTSFYHIMLNILPEYLRKEGIIVLRTEVNYWIRKEDLIPIQYSTVVDIIMNNDTLHQYEKYVLNKVMINNLSNDTILTLQSIPHLYKLQTYEPNISPKLLPNYTIAPDWNLLSTKDENICLKDLKGKLVLIDFFYSSCYPCLITLPRLEALYERYKDKGLVIIGIDPYDKKEDTIEKFLSIKRVNYSVLLGGKNVVKDYHISAYPTIYLIDKDGRIIFTQVGYGFGTLMLENLIKKYLKL